MNDSDEILSITEVAANLRCSKAHVYNAINGKVAGLIRLPAIRLGRRKLVRRASLETWKSANEAGSMRPVESQPAAIQVAPVPFAPPENLLRRPRQIRAFSGPLAFRAVESETPCSRR